VRTESAKPVPMLSKSIFPLRPYRLRTGDYISVLEEHGRDHAHRIVSAVPAPALAHPRMGS